ncbi:MAG: carboxymuconolactone decarboxylase family protein [Burkholderiales bacterium]|nr:carboxymuconolactone decarboxylase family protein [Burkholderiales bacterium]
MVKRIISYVPADIAQPAELVNAIRERRGGHLLELDRMLLHSAPFAKGWNAFLKEVRQNLSINAKLRELAILAVAVLNKADYEFFQHAPVYLQAGGTQQELLALKSLGIAGYELGEFSPLEQEVCELAVSMTRDIVVPDQLLQTLKNTLGETQVVELVGVISTYNMVSRFLVALNIHPKT